jgi:hypothetical protein
MCRYLHSISTSVYIAKVSDSLVVVGPKDLAFSGIAADYARKRKLHIWENLEQYFSEIQLLTTTPVLIKVSS